MTVEQLPEAVRTLVRPHQRPAFVPEVEAGDTVERVSKIGGAPWLSDGADWPVCPNCHKPMQLIIQLDLERLPEGAPDYGKGLAQLFYCTNDAPLCEVDCEAFFPFAKSVVARVLSGTSGKSAPVQAVPNPVEAKRIVGWRREEDVPQSQELSDELNVDGADEDDVFEALTDAELPLGGDKLAGWPLWVQGIEYPACPTCKEKMRLLFQIDSNDLVGVQWGDLGCGHLTQCAEHKDQLAFGWACG